MSWDYEERRRLSNACLDRRQDRLDLMRTQQRRTHAVYEGLRRGDPGAAGHALGVAAPASAHREERDDRCEDECAAAASAVSRRRHAVFARIDTLHDIDGTVRRDWRNRFDAIEVLLRDGADAVERFGGGITAQTQALRDLARRLRATLEAMQARLGPWPVPQLARGTPSAADLLDRFFPMGLDGIVRQIEQSTLIDASAKQRWIAPLQGLERLQGAPRIAAPAAHLFATLAPLVSKPDWRTRHAETAAASQVADEIDEAAGCGSLHTALLLLRADCALYRAALRRAVM